MPSYYIYKCIFLMDDGYTKYPNTVEFIVSKQTLSKDEIRAELYKRQPYKQYDVYIDDLRVIPVVLMKDVTVLGRDC